MKKIAIFGSTGSIGVNVLEIVKKFPDRFKVTSLTVNSNISVLENQIKIFSPEVVCVKEENFAEELKNKINTKCKILSGEDGLIEIAKNSDYDIFVGAMVGFCGLAPTIEAIKRGKRIALANKETLVVAGELITKLIKDFSALLIPIDSEHSAIFQCLIGENISEVNRLILTASGGPFLNKNKNEFCNITVDEALKHPNWKMGNKISIDSATMMNKGLEVIEAHWLFNLAKEKIGVVVHPQSVIHSLVEFVDGSIKAQLSLPDMRLPIQFALTYPQRLESNFVKTNLHLINNLTFYEPDFEKFECLKIAFDILGSGGTSCCILNAANEVAVNKFFNNQIKFSTIPDIIKKSLDKIENHQKPDLETIFECDKLTREFAQNLY